MSRRSALLPCARVRTTVASLVVICALATVALSTPASAAQCVSDTGISCEPFNVKWGFDDRVRAILRVGNVIYLGGRFHTAIRSNPDGSVAETEPRDHLAAIDANTGDLLPWAPRVDEDAKENGDVYVLDSYTPQGASGPLIFAVGDFVSVEVTSNGTSYDQVDREHFAAFDPGGFGDVDPLRIDTAHRTRAMVVDGDRLYLGGSFGWVDTSSQPKIHQGKLAAFDLANGGSMITSWTPQADGGVNDMDVLPDGNVAVGGQFTSLTDGTTTTGGFMGEVAPDGSVLSWATPPVGKVLDVKVAPGDRCGLDPSSDACILTGQGDVPGQHAPNNTAVLYDEAGSQMWLRDANGDVQAVGWFAGRAIIGGHFGKIRDGGSLGTVKIKKVAALDPLNDGHIDISWQPNLAPASSLGVWGIQGYSDTLFLGGEFLQAKGEPTVRFAQFAFVP